MDKVKGCGESFGRGSTLVLSVVTGVCSSYTFFFLVNFFIFRYKLTDLGAHSCFHHIDYIQDYHFPRYARKLRKTKNCVN